MVFLDGRNGSAKLIAGNLLGVTGPADTRVPILIADITVPQVRLSRSPLLLCRIV